MEIRVGIQGVTETELPVRKSIFTRKRFMKNCYIEVHENPEDDLVANARQLPDGIYLHVRRSLSFIKEAYLSSDARRSTGILGHKS